MKYLINKVRAFGNDESGASGVELGLMVAFVSIAIIIAVNKVTGERLAGMFLIAADGLLDGTFDGQN